MWSCTSATTSKPAIRLQYTSPDPLSPCVASEPMPASTSPSLPWQLQCTYNYRKEHLLCRPGITLVWTPLYAWLKLVILLQLVMHLHKNLYYIIYLHVTPIYNCNCCVIVYSIELQWAGNVAAQASKLLVNIYLIHACRCCEFGFIRYL